MKIITSLTLATVFLTVSSAFAQAPYDITEDLLNESNTIVADIGDNGFKFEALTTGINSKYADYGSGLFMDKFISFSARKIGALAKKDPVTNEPFTRLYCSDILENYDLTRPLLFSSLLNKDENLGSVSFSQDGNTLFFTKSTEGSTQTFQLYKTVMDPDTTGRWMEITPVPFNEPGYSIENPHISKDGTKLFFSSNRPSSKGGFDIYQVDVNEDGTYGEVAPVAGLVNTEMDEKFPHLSVDQKFLFFSSKGHENAGGFDVFKSRRTQNGYVTVINLGNTINTEQDEIAFVPATERIGYITSNREGGNGNFDIYRITEYVISQEVKGTTLDFDTKTPLPGVEVLLIDTDGTEVGKAISDENGKYTFPISSFEYYTVVSSKDGYLKGSTIFNTDNETKLYETDVTLKIKPAPIVETPERNYIQIDNILFDYNSAAIKSVSTINLNKVVQTMRSNPEIKVTLDAHSDSRGNDNYNLELSEQRAAAAMDYLIGKGISRDRLLSKGYGESKPVFDCDPCTEQQYETNRRIEFNIIED